MKQLKRELNLIDVTLAGVGIIIGAGIYAIIGKAAGIVGNAIWLSFLIGAIVAGITALSYAELSSMFPKSGAEYVYTKRSFGNRIAFLVNWLLLIGTVFSVATVSLGFATYLNYFVKIPYTYVAVGLILLFTLLNIYGIKESITIANIGSIAGIIGLLIIIIPGLNYIGSVDYFEMPTPDYSLLLFGASLLFFAFLGFESIPRLSEETENPRENIPKATLLSLLISSVIYILISIVAVSVIGWKELSISDAPLAVVAEKILGSEAGILLAIIALFATSNTVLLMLVTTSRLLYGFSESGRIFKKLGSLSKRNTPWIAAVVIGILSIIPALTGDIGFVAYSADFATFFTFATINLAVVWFRITEKETERKFKIPDVFGFPFIPLLGFAVCILLAFASGIEIIFLGFVLLAIGAVLYETLKKAQLVY